MTWTKEVWTIKTQPARGFDPKGFDNLPKFDTGSPAGIWTPVEKPEDARDPP